MPQPIEPRRLLRQANELGYRDGGRGRPRNDALRRATSAAYYALFHRISWAMAEHLLPDGGHEDQARLTRSVDHRKLKEVCLWVTGREGKQGREHVRPIVKGVSTHPALVNLADAVIELQEQRHAADYDHLAEFSKAGVLGLVDMAEAGLDTVDELSAASSAELAGFMALVALNTSIR